MSILSPSRTLLLAAGLGLSLAAPARATEQTTWNLRPAPRAAAPQVAILPPLPEPPRVFAITPERRALLNTIRYAEGTWANGHHVGYRVMFGGSLMNSLDRHPDRVMYSSRYASAAAGAYQFMPFTWNLVVRSLGVRDFRPKAQDQGALFLVQRRGALELADQGQMTPELAAKLAPEWASFPTLAGNSFYGQPVKRFEDLRRFYEENLAMLRAGGTTDTGEQEVWETVAIRRAPACTARTLDCMLEQVGAGAERSGAGTTAVESRY